MNQLNIQKLDKGRRFILSQKKTNLFVLIVLSIVTIITIAIPIQVLLASEVSQAAIIGAIISAVLAAYLHRLLLWNAFGKEVFEVSDSRLWHYTDYKLFKDTLLDIEKPEQLIFDFDNLNDSKKGYLLYINDQQKELTRSNIRLSKEEIGEMIRLMKMVGKNK